MRDAMSRAEVGDDVFGDDPTVNRLQATLAEQLGFEAGLFVASGTQSNLLALMAHCERGDEYLVGQDAHTYKYEGGGAAVLGSIQPQPLEQERDGSMPLHKIKNAIKPNDPHFARTKLLALENTFHGNVLNQTYIEQACAFAHAQGLQTHLDGARFFNAVVACNGDAGAMLKPFDSVSICLSKGLGAPVGSVLLGRQELIQKARRWRKVVGGGMRQAGILAAAGMYAIENNVTRLADDHRRAQMLADGLQSMAGIQCSIPQTNMVFIDVDEAKAQQLQQHLAEQKILVTGLYRLRLVTHLDINDNDIKTVINAFKSFL
jgi:threonine aldolase